MTAVSPDRAESPSAAGLISRSHLGIEPFGLRRPASLADAAAAVASGSWAHAGGIDVAQRLRAGEVADEVVPLSSPQATGGAGLDRLTMISVGENTLFIGAAVTHARIESDSLVRAHRPDLAAAWRTIGNVRVRAAGTLGGNLAASDQGYDAAPILAAAGAEIIVAEPDGTRVRCAVADVPPDRLIVGAEVPLDGRVVYDRSLKPVVSVAIGNEAVAIGCAYAQTRVIPHGADNAEEVTAALAALENPIDDAFASATYRRRMIGVLLERSLRAFAETASPSDVGGANNVTHFAAPVRSPTSLRGTGRTAQVEMLLNGEPFSEAAPPSEMLVDTIRSRAGLGGTRVGCDQAVCGACTVLVDGTPTASCSTFSWQVEGREVLTIEAGGAASVDGVSGDFISILSTVQETFVQTSAFQCGYCTPGLILVAAALLARHPEPDRITICDWLDSNICRCTGYLMVIEAVEAAAAAVRNRGDANLEDTP